MSRYKTLVKSIGSTSDSIDELELKIKKELLKYPKELAISAIVKRVPSKLKDACCGKLSKHLLKKVNN